MNPLIKIVWIIQIYCAHSSLTDDQQAKAIDVENHNEQ